MQLLVRGGRRGGENDAEQRRRGAGWGIWGNESMVELCVSWGACSWCVWGVDGNVDCVGVGLKKNKIFARVGVYLCACLSVSLCVCVMLSYPAIAVQLL